MAAIVIRENARTIWLPGLAGVGAKASGLVQRAVDHAAAGVMICAVGAALFQLAVQLASFPPPVAVTAFTLIAVASCQSLRQHRHARAGRRPERGSPASPG